MEFLAGPCSRPSSRTRAEVRSVPGRDHRRQHPRTFTPTTPKCCYDNQTALMIVDAGVVGNRSLNVESLGCSDPLRDRHDAQPWTKTDRLE